MYWEKIKNDICVEVLAMDEEGTKVIIREIVGDELSLLKTNSI